MDNLTRCYVRTHRDRQMQYYRTLVDAHGDPGVTSMAYAAMIGLDTVARAHAIGLDVHAVNAHQLAAFRGIAAASTDAAVSTYAGLIADVFRSIGVRMGDIGEPLHEDEGADEEPLSVPEVWPETVPEHEPVPA